MSKTYLRQWAPRRSVFGRQLLSEGRQRLRKLDRAVARYRRLGVP